MPALRPIHTLTRCSLPDQPVLQGISSACILLTARRSPEITSYLLTWLYTPWSKTIHLTEYRFPPLCVWIRKEKSPRLDRFHTMILKIDLDQPEHRQVRSPRLSLLCTLTSKDDLNQPENKKIRSLHVDRLCMAILKHDLDKLRYRN